VVFWKTIREDFFARGFNENPLGDNHIPKYALATSPLNPKNSLLAFLFHSEDSPHYQLFVVQRAAIQ
jgi:hypothetical protein